MVRHLASSQKHRTRPSGRALVAGDDAATVKRALSSGDFGDTVSQALDALVRRQKREVLKPDWFRELGRLKARCVAAEALDHYGRWPEARRLTEPAAVLAQELVALSAKRAASVAAVENRDIAREQIRLYLAFVQAHFYRTHHYQLAQEAVLRCEEAVRVIRQEATYPCYGTMARIAFFLGRIHRQTGAYQQAEVAFRDAIGFLDRRASHYLARHRECPSEVSLDKRNLEVASSKYKTAVCLALGLGWLCYSRGELGRALSYTVPAHVHVIDKTDGITVGYVDLIRGSVLRSRAGSDHELLDEAREYAHRAHDAFADAGHKFYQARAAYELANIAYQKGNGDEALEHLNHVTDTPPEADTRWLANSLILRSRIACHLLRDSRRAEEYAMEALRKAQQSDLVSCETGALISLGEVKFSQSRYAEARGFFEAVLDPGARSFQRRSEIENTHVAAICLLNIARCYGRERQVASAKDSLNRGRMMAAGVENQSVRELVSTVEIEIASRGRDFVVLAGDRTASYSFREHQAGLKQFLYDQVRQFEHQKSKMAGMLGISRQALHQWESQMTPKAPV
jgi:tetratricopeptide (TPR) repeat protein